MDTLPVEKIVTVQVKGEDFDQVYEYLTFNDDRPLLNKLVNVLENEDLKFLKSVTWNKANALH